MNEYEYEVTLKVSVEAFNDVDAFDAVQDAFGLGDFMGLNVIECEIK